MPGPGNKNWEKDEFTGSHHFMFLMFPYLSHKKKTMFKMLQDPSPGGPCENKSSKDQNYCCAGKLSQKNATKPFSSEGLLAMLTPVFGVGSKASFPFHTLNRVTAIYGASPAFSTNFNQKQLQLCSALCPNNWEHYL